MPYMNIKSIIAPFIFVAVLNGCATVDTEVKSFPPGKVIVESTRAPSASGGFINDYSNVRIVTATSAIGKNTLSVLTAVPRIFLSGGSNVYLEKTEMHGDELETAEKKKIVNPLFQGKSIVESTQSNVDAFIHGSESFRSKTFKNKLFITSGATRLIYESLTGSDSERYRLHVTMRAYKVIENPPTDTLEIFKASWAGELKPNVPVVDCSYVSEQPLGIDEWLKADHLLLNHEMARVGEACTFKIKNDLQNLLSR